MIVETRVDKSDVTLFRGDCLEFLKTLEPGSVSAVVTDPPYGIEHSSGRGASWQNTQIAGDSDARLRDAIIDWAEARNLPWAAFGTWKVPSPSKTKAVLVWDKGPAFGMGDLSFPWKPSWEEIAIGGVGWKGKRDEGVLRGHIQVSWESKGRKHPHQKPVSLISELLKKLPGVSTVLDPFMGSGGTGVACVRAGINFIGCELDEKYFKIAQRRIKEAGMPLFAGCEL